MRRYFLFVFVAVAVICMLFLGGRKMLAQSTLAPQMVTQAVDDSKLVTLRGNVYPAAHAENDHGIAPANMQLNHMMLVLNRSAAQQAALDTLDAQQADKSSPNFHKWLTPQEFGQQFGVSDEDLNAVTSWLESHGFQVNGVANGRNMVDFSGTTENIREAFHTEIHHFVVNGQDHYANVSDPQIPAALAPIVAGVSRLNDFRPQPMHRNFGTIQMSMKDRKVTRVTPEYTLTGLANNTCLTGSTNCYAVAPYDLATIYNLLPVWNANCPNTTTACNGAGVNIAIVSDSDVRDVDYQQFRSLVGLPALSFNSGQGGTINRILATGVNPGIQGTPPCTADTDEDEAILDVEWAGATAPGAQIDLVMAPTANSCGSPSTTGETGLPTGDTFGGDYAAFYAVNTVNDPILTDSYGECELLLGAAANTFYSNLWQQANTQGITVVTAAGDNGSAGCDSSNSASLAQDGLEVNGTASTPYDVAVGGTDFAYSSGSAASAYWNTTNSASGTNSSTLSAKGSIPETTYNDSCTNTAFALGSTAANSCAYVYNNAGNGVGAAGEGGASSCTSTNGGGVAPADCKGGYAKPSWQTGTGVPVDSARDIPDVSLFSGDFNGPSSTFYVVCEEDLTNPPAACSLSASALQIEGGTSLSAQAFAGMVAVLDQYQGGVQSKAFRIGSVAFNTNLYALANAEGAASCNNSSTAIPNSNTTCVTRDVTTGTNSVPCVANSTNCGSSVTSQLLPNRPPTVAFRWSPLNIVLIVCIGCAVSLMLLLPGKQRRWSTAFALVLLAVLIGSVSCGGGSYNGTGGGGGGGTTTVGVLSGYNAGVGYDRATGLGSVNAANMIKASGWVNFNH